MIPRNKYLHQLAKRMNNGKIKIVTGIRRCGKSVLINEIFYEYLLSQGTAYDHIIRLSLEDNINAKYRNPLRLDEYIRSLKGSYHAIQRRKWNFVYWRKRLFAP